MPSILDIRKKWFETERADEAKANVKTNPPRDPANFRDHIKMPWPYYAPAESLPAPLPTIEDIEKVRGTEGDLTQGFLAWFSHGYKYRVNGHFLVKFGRNVDIAQEAENLLFLSQHSSVRVPKLYAAFDHNGGDPTGAFRDPDGRQFLKKSRKLPTYCYLVEEFMEGGNLQDMWAYLHPDIQKDISIKLGEQYRLLREIPSPGYYGRVHEQPILHRFPGVHRLSNPLGLYKTYGDFANAVADIYEINMAYEPGPSPDGDQFALDHFRNEILSCQCTTPKFSNPNLYLSSIYLKPTTTVFPGGKQIFDVVLADWNGAAWLPAWVDAALVLQLGDFPTTQHNNFMQHGDPLAHDKLRLYASRGFNPFPYKDALWWIGGLVPASMRVKFE